MDIVELKQDGLTHTQIDILCQLDPPITTIKQLWDTVGENREVGIIEVSKRTGIPKEQLEETLVKRAVRDVDRRERAWLKRNWIEVVMAFSILTLIAFGIRLSDIPIIISQNLGLRHSVIVATRDLPPSTVLGLADVTSTTVVVPPTGAISTEPTAIGKVTRKSISQGSPVVTSMLVTPPQKLEGWWAITIPISSTLPLTIGQTVGVLGIRDGITTAALISEQAVIINSKGGSVTIALPRDQAQRAVTFLLDNRRLVLVERLP